MQSPHDTLFGFTFRHAWHAAGWLRHVLPEAIREAIDWSTLTAIRERFADARLRAQIADSGFAAAMRIDDNESPDQANPVANVDVLMLTEHKSYDDPDVDTQLLRYTIHLRRTLQQRPGRPPFVLCTLLRHGASPRTSPVPAPGSLRALLHEAAPHQLVFVDDLDTVTEPELAARNLTPLAKLTLLCLKVLRGAEPDEVPRCFDRWQHLLREVDRADAPPLTPPLGRDAIDAIGWYALAVTNVAPEVLSETFHRILLRPEDTIMSTLERTYQKGLAAGAALGKAEGKAEGKSDTLLRMLRKRFPPLAQAIEARVCRAPIADLDRWTDRILDATTLEDVFAD